MAKLSTSNLKTTRDFENVLDSMANHIDGAGGENTPLVNYMKFVSGDYFGLGISTSNDAAADTGFAMTANTLHESAYDGGGASAITLPDAEVGTLCVYRYTAQADGGQTQTFTAKGSDTFAAGTLNTDVTNLGDASNHSRRVFVSSAVETVATFGGAIVTVGATHNRLSIATTATNNQTNAGAEVSFYCSSEGKWRIAFLPSELGSGALNATFETSAA